MVWRTTGLAGNATIFSSCDCSILRKLRLKAISVGWSSNKYEKSVQINLKEWKTGKQMKLTRLFFFHYLLFCVENFGVEMA